jgi:hypothetical protein
VYGGDRRMTRSAFFISVCLLTFAFSTWAYQEDFDDGEANDWVVVTGTWEVENGEYHQIPDGVNLFSFYAVEDESWKDYTLEVKLKPIQTPYAGVVFRVMETGPGGAAPAWSQGHFISWLIGTTGGKGYSKIWKAMLGPEAMLEGTDGDTLEPNEWSEIKVVIEGINIQCYLNGELQKEFKDDNDSILTGGIGLMTYGETLFDDIVVTGHGIPGMAVRPAGKLVSVWGAIRYE